jgi:hypothetical protein
MRWPPPRPHSGKTSRCGLARMGEHALEVADELGFLADVIVVDLSLGPGMSGDDLLRSTASASAVPRG